MDQDIDLFDEKYPRDYRWDTDRNAKLLNIVFQGGTFGNFLKFFIEKFSTKTSEMDKDPFTEVGASEAVEDSEYSGLVQKYHPEFINDNEGQTDLPVCVIVASTRKHFLYLKKAQWYRVGSHKISPDDLWKKAVGEMPERIKSQADNIIDLYDIPDMAHFSWIPKFIVRDWYKLEFLKPIEETHNHRWFELFKNHTFFKKQNTYYLDMETFFGWQTFLASIKKLDNEFGLALDFDRQVEMEELFEKGLSLDNIRQECNLALEVLESNLDTSLADLDVATEGFLYAELEKNNDFIQMPLTNRFFRDTAEINQFIEHYPGHYKAMNPNMPKFNGIPNPYYLKKDK
jgi:hypothetical protein